MVFRAARLFGFELRSKFMTIPFSPAENVMVLSVATATGTMPVTAGFIGIILALEHLIEPEVTDPLRMNWTNLRPWSISICLFGLKFASMAGPLSHRTMRTTVARGGSGREQRQTLAHKPSTGIVSSLGHVEERTREVDEMHALAQV